MSHLPLRFSRALAFALVAFLALPLAASTHTEAPSDAPADVLTPWDVARLQAVGSIAASPDGDHVAYTLSVPRNALEDENGPAFSELHVHGPDGSRPYVTGEVNVGSVDWTPDGSAVTFLAKREGDEERTLWAIPLAGGEARRMLSHDTGVNGYSFSPDGSQVAFIASGAEDETREVARVVPRAGSFACFLADRVPHEVLPTARPRASIAGWFRRNASLHGVIDPAY